MEQNIDPAGCAILDTYFPSPWRSYPELFLPVEYTFPPGLATDATATLGSVVSQCLQS